MKLLSRVVWAEGMYLAPQHFQAQNRYFEEAVHFATASLWRDAYGLAACQLDADALRNGTVSLLHARGMFQDGLPFDIPECDPRPDPHNIRRTVSARHRQFDRGPGRSPLGPGPAELRSGSDSVRECSLHQHRGNGARREHGTRRKAGPTGAKEYPAGRAAQRKTRIC